MVTLESVYFAYGNEEKEEVALKNVTFSLLEGEFIAVIGSNGSGKSTLVKMVNGLLLPKRGEVCVDGFSTRDYKSLQEIRRRVGVLFQNPENQIVGGTVEDDVAFGLENAEFPREEIAGRIQETLLSVGLTGMEKVMPHTLSGGQKQRLALAGLLAICPKYLVLDEPTTMLDPLGKEEIRKHIISICRSQSIGLLIVTHLMDESVLADKIVVLHEGEIIGEGFPKEIFANSELLKKAKVSLPAVGEIAQELVNDGVYLELPQLSVEGLVSALSNI